ncbi:hypothetical protein HY087_01920 [Candidatus Gottesmanbacteria bacterium]|nr:hypothetical protein [Candidatus Gottesmanbacteria bacterium]
MRKKKLPLVWDAWNREHIKKHSLTIAEAEEAYTHSLASFTAKAGRTGIIAKIKNGRMIVIFLSFERQKGPYVVSARDANVKERSIVYEQAKTNQTI